MTVATRQAETRLAREMAEHRGQWVAIKDDRIVASGRTPAEVFAILDRDGIRGAAVDRVPEDPDTVFVL